MKSFRDTPPSTLQNAKCEERFSSQPWFAISHWDYEVALQLLPYPIEADIRLSLHDIEQLMNTEGKALKNCSNQVSFFRSSLASDETRRDLGAVVRRL